VSLTRFGWQSAAFYAAMLAAYFAAPYANLTFLLLSFLTLCGVLGAWWSARNLRAVTAEIAAPPPIAAGRAGAIEARLASRGTRFGVELELELEDGSRIAGSAPVLRGAAEVRLSVPPLGRGIRAVRRTRLCSTHPLGVFAAARAVEGPEELVVYPAPALELSARSLGGLLAELRGELPGPALEPAGLRPWVEGDAPRDVHWRASARAGKLVVRDWERAGGEGLELEIDRRTSAPELEQALALASAVVHWARERKEQLQLSSQGLCASFGEGHRPWSEALRFLAGAQALPPDAPAPPPAGPSVVRLPRRASMGAPRRASAAGAEARRG
jgi:uncharacterized protein (DUF58 family)